MHRRPSYVALLAASILGIPAAHGQTFAAIGGPIPDDGTWFEFNINASFLPPAIDTISFGVERVCIDLEHTWIADLDITIVAPDGTAALLVGGNGGDTDFYTNTCFTADATTVITSGAPPYTGEFRPMTQMGTVNNGQDPNGTWKLRILDTYPFADAGELFTWSITFGPEPAHYIGLSSSDLPIVVINTGGTPIPNEPKVPAEMGIIWNGPGVDNHPTDPYNDFDGRIGIELRGNSSLAWPKKSYGIELWDTLDNDLDAPILGMPAESDWVLRSSYSDKSLLNDALTMHVFEEMGHYAPRWRHVDLILDGQYLGVYLLMEKIKRDGQRVDIARLDPDEITGDDLTGGYMVKIDWWQGGFTGGWTSPYPPLENSNGQTIEFYYDTPAQPVPEQAAYIQAYVDSFETALATEDLADTVNGYRRYASVTSFIDMFILNELSRNVDGYRLSTYLHKDKNSNGGKLKIGPPWDFDLAWHNADYYGGNVASGWAWSAGSTYPGDIKQIPFWWERFMDDPRFTDSLNCRWERFSGEFLGVNALQAWCDSMAAVLDQAQQRNFQVWPTLGVYLWPNPSPIPTTYAGEITELKNWIAQRWTWMNMHLPGLVNGCYHVGMIDVPVPEAFNAYPNPFSSTITLDLSSGTSAVTSVRLFDALGREVHVHRIDRSASIVLKVPADIPAGIFALRVESAGRMSMLPLVRATAR